MVDVVLIVGLALSSFLTGVFFHAQVVTTVAKIIATLKAEEAKLSGTLNKG